MTVEHWVLQEHFYQLREDSGNILGWKSARAEGSGRGCCETLSSKQDVATVLANSQPQPLWSPTQEQVSQHSSLDGEGLMRPHPLLSWQLGCWRRGSHFSSAMWPSVGCPRSGGWPHANARTGSTNWDSVFFFFFLRRGQGGKEMCWRDGMGRGGDEYDIIYCIHT